MRSVSLEKRLRVLRVLTPLVELTAVAAFAAALATTDWLRTEEKMPNRNRTVLFGPNKSVEYLSKLTRSGLFRLCHTKPGMAEFSCVHIDYYPQDFYEPDQSDATASIPYAVVNCSWFIFCGGLLLAVAVVLAVCGHCAARNKIASFIAGIVFVVAGLFIFLGQVVYISILKGEVSSKLVPESMLSPPRLSYTYGWSFASLVLAFLCCEVGGVLSVFLFTWFHEHKWHTRHADPTSAARLRPAASPVPALSWMQAQSPRANNGFLGAGGHCGSAVPRSRPPYQNGGSNRHEEGGNCTSNGTNWGPVTLFDCHGTTSAGEWLQYGASGDPGQAVCRCLHCGCLFYTQDPALPMWHAVGHCHDSYR